MRRFSLSPFEVITPNQPSTKMMSGSWKTNPNAMIVFSTMEM